MKELNLTQEPANEIGGGPRVAASPQERAQLAKSRVMAIYTGGVSPSFESFISRREDGTSCACVIGTLALGVGSKILADKRVAAEEASGDYATRTALVNQVCGATLDFSIEEVLSLEDGYMGWEHGHFSISAGGRADTRPFYEVGMEIAKEVRARL